MFTSSKLNVYALKKDNYISISIQTPKVQTSIKKQIIKPLTKPVEQKSVVEPKEVNIDDLFSDVWTKSIKKPKKKPKKKIDNKRLQEIQKKSKKIDEKNVKSVLKQENSNIINKSDESNKVSTATQVNEYLAKIQALVYENFKPPPNSQGTVVLAVIKISAIGKVLDFRILTYSANEAMNSECDKIRARLMGVLFPSNIENKTHIQKINLISEE
ncbi:MAG: TonB C-terminal domain-containing protein [Campylobacterota bacterium]|nr:TonB C-terminal domain-containing protein [Campylobacterota bacterium]